ncbi:hypothetical protein NQZ68_029826 [Dissostichus eleginoides]|nr:hypothetical protein NQZ68_029826 [Dissostichus eleginoides]
MFFSTSDVMLPYNRLQVTTRETRGRSETDGPEGQCEGVQEMDQVLRLWILDILQSAQSVRDPLQDSTQRWGLHFRPTWFQRKEFLCQRKQGADFVLFPAAQGAVLHLRSADSLR